MHNTLNNNLFGGMSASKLKAVEQKATRHSTIKICSTYLTPAREVVPIAECLVAYSPVTDTITKFIAAFVPASPSAKHQGCKFLISKNQDGSHRPVLVKNHGKSDPDFYWNEAFQSVFLDHSMLPSIGHSEFRVLRTYRKDVRGQHRFELLNFEQPPAGQPVNKKTMVVEQQWNSVPPIALARTLKGFFWWQRQITEELSAFSGVDLMVCLGLGIERTLAQSVEPKQLEEILMDHSEEVGEPLSVTFGVTNMVTPEEGKPFYVPEIPAEPQAVSVEAAPEKKKRKERKASAKRPRKVKAEQSVAASAGEVEFFD